MDLYWNLSSNRLVTGLQSAVPITAMEFKRRDGAEFRIHFLRSGSQDLVEMPSTLDIRFGLKEVGDFGGPVVVFADTFTESDGLWIANPSFNTTELDALFGSDPEEAAVQLIGELTFRNDVGEPWQSTQTFLVTVQNDVIRGDEGTPSSVNDPTAYLTEDESNARFVRYDEAQSLTSGEQEQARDNLGITSSSAVDVQIFTANGTWTDPSSAEDLPCDIVLIGGGGGGGSGRKGAGNTGIGGGGGGGGGAIVRLSTTTARLRSILSTTGASVTVGAGGAGGAARTEEDTAGESGAAGGATSFAGLTAVGGTAGGGGGQTTSVGTGGAAQSNACLSLDAAASTLAGGRGGVGDTAAVAGGGAVAERPCGGGGGAGYDDTNVEPELPGALGGRHGNATIGLFSSVTASPFLPGQGGDGGPGEGDPGTTGGSYGAGGGGGAYGVNDQSDSGAGGAGGPGIAMITTYLS
jgi:hypothetical protein